jgi:hypothetical protein
MGRPVPEFVKNLGINLGPLLYFYRTSKSTIYRHAAPGQSDTRVLQRSEAQVAGLGAEKFVAELRESAS